MIAQQISRPLTEIDQWNIKALLGRVTSNPAEERDALRKLRGFQPHRKEYVYQLAESYFHTADNDEAIAYYQMAIGLDSQFGQAYNHMGFTYSWKGDHESAINALNQYLKITPSANAFDSLGSAYMYAGRYEEAARMKVRAYEANPDLYFIKRGQALIEIAQGKLGAAESRLRAYIASSTDDSEAARYYAVLAFLYYQRGELEPALKACFEGIRLFGNATTPYDQPADELYWLNGLIELKRGNFVGARRALQVLNNVVNNKKISASNFKPWYKFARHLEMRIGAEEHNGAVVKQAANDLEFIKGKLGYRSTIYDCAFIFDEMGQAHGSLGS